MYFEKNWIQISQGWGGRLSFLKRVSLSRMFDSFEGLLVLLRPQREISKIKKNNRGNLYSKQHDAFWISVGSPALIHLKLPSSITSAWPRHTKKYIFYCAHFWYESGHDSPIIFLFLPAITWDIGVPVSGIAAALTISLFRDFAEFSIRPKLLILLSFRAIS